MAALLIWRTPGSVFPRTGTTPADCFNDLASMVNAKAADVNYSWQVASVNNAATPPYCVLKKKSGVPGRVLFVAWLSAPAGINPTILDQTPTVGVYYIAYFPNGNVDTPSNLNVASGTIMGNDTDAIKVVPTYGTAGQYSSMQLYYFDSTEAIWIGFQSAGTSAMLLGAGDIIVDQADNSYPAVFGSGNNFLSLERFITGGLFSWTSTRPAAGSTAGCVRTGFGGMNRGFYQAFSCSSWWNSGADWLTDVGTGKALFVPHQLFGNVRDQYQLAFRLRQVAVGPNVGMPFSTVISGGQIIAICSCGRNSGGIGHPWFMNVRV